jgi:hypothetical protein
MTRAPASADQSPRHRVRIVGAGFDGRFATQPWLASWPALLVVTRGGAGVDAVCAGLELNRGAVPLDLVDTIEEVERFLDTLPR